jgi:hypothetical protein
VLGYSMSLGEVFPGVNAMAVPVAVDGSVRFALGFLGTAKALPAGRAARLAFELRTVAKEVADRLSTAPLASTGDNCVPQASRRTQRVPIRAAARTR